MSGNVGITLKTPPKRHQNMPKLNDTQVQRLKHKAERYDLRDTVERGLLMRVGKKEGSKQWHTFVYEMEEGKRMRRMVRLGVYPQMKVAAARIAAATAKSNTGLSKAPTDVQTVSDLFALYKAFAEPKRRAWRDVQGAWDNWARDRIGHIRLTDLTAHHARDLRNHVTAKSSELRGNAIIRYIRPMFRWAVNDALMPDNPWQSFTANVTAPQRDRVLDATEWQAVWDASFGDSMGEYFRFLMMSAQRKSNVASMRWDELQGDVWTIPREKMKATRADSAKAHEVPLTPAMSAIINARYRVGEYVFGMDGSKPLSFGSRQKDRIGARAGITDWRVHDIRRTAGTLMTSNGVSRFMMQRVLGHADSGVGSVYDLTNYREEKRDALAVLASSVEMDGCDNVVALKSGSTI